MKNIKSILPTIFALLLAACGGGGGDPGSSTSTGGTTPAATPIVVKVTLPANAVVTQGAEVEVSALVQTDKGAALPGLLVTFTTKLGLGAFIPESGTALTNASGIAKIRLVPKVATSSGADEVIATVASGSTTATGSVGFTLTATNVTISDVKSDVTTVASYGQTGITVTLAGAAQGVPVAVSLSSNCGAKILINPAQATTTNGSASFTAIDQGCGAERSTIVFTAAIVGTSNSRTVNVGVSAPTASSLKFVTASPEAIFLKGSGFLEVSIVTFEVVDQGGNPLPNQDVKLELTTTVGGLTLNDSANAVTVKSDSNGKVIGRVNAGTVPAPVRVRATLALSGVATVSSNLTVGVGLPSQRNFSLSQGTINIEGFNYDGTPNTYSIFAADRSGNPVPTGTVINFVTEGGQIQSSRQTTLNNGIASAVAQFVSQAPRPADGRVTITAYAVGEESFVDTNGNNVWDSGEPFQDLGDVYKDTNFSQTFSAGEEVFPFGKTGGCAISNDPLLGYGDGIGTNVAGTCDGTWGRAFVRRSTETVFSSSFARPVWIPGAVPLIGGGGPITIPVDGIGTSQTYTLVNGSRIGTSALSTEQLTACQSAFDLIATPTLSATIPVASGTAVLTYTPGASTCPASAVVDPTVPPSASETARLQALNNAENLANASAIARSLSTRVCRAIRTGGAGLFLSDDNAIRFNPMPAGTKLSVKTTDGLTVEINQDTVGSSSVPTAHSFSWKFADTASVGTATFSFTTPKGNGTSVAVGIETASSAFIPTAPTVTCKP
jgi:hypothetical protein